jgi:hypothetical protein
LNTIHNHSETTELSRTDGGWWLRTRLHTLNLLLYFPLRHANQPKALVASEGYRHQLATGGQYR